MMPCDFPAEDRLPYGKATGQTAESCDDETLQGMIVKLEWIIYHVNVDQERFKRLSDSLMCAVGEVMRRERLIGGVRVTA